MVGKTPKVEVEGEKGATPRKTKNGTEVRLKSVEMGL